MPSFRLRKPSAVSSGPEVTGLTGGFVDVRGVLCGTSLRLEPAGTLSASVLVAGAGVAVVAGGVGGCEVWTLSSLPGVSAAVSLWLCTLKPTSPPATTSAAAATPDVTATARRLRRTLRAPATIVRGAPPGGGRSNRSSADSARNRRATSCSDPFHR